MENHIEKHMETDMETGLGGSGFRVNSLKQVLCESQTYFRGCDAVKDPLSKHMSLETLACSYMGNLHIKSSGKDILTTEVHSVCYLFHLAFEPTCPPEPKSSLEP